MPVTRIQDVFVPAVYDTLQVAPSPVRRAFLNSGIAVSTPRLLGLFNGGGKFITMPFWNKFPRNLEPNMSDDDPTRFAVPNKVDMSSMQARKAWLNQGFSEADLTEELAGASPMQHVRNNFGDYWDTVEQKRLIATCLGLMRENIANGSSDMIIDITAADKASIGDNNRFSVNAFIDANFTLGDAFGTVGIIAVHSFVYRRMVKENLITPPSESTFNLPGYMGKGVIFDDGMPILGDDTTGYKYVSMIFGRGALAFARGTHGVPSELERDPRAANGAGVTSLWERKTMMIHPLGYNWTDASITPRATATPGFDGPEISPTTADLAKAANWRRVYDRKTIPLAFLITN